MRKWILLAVLAFVLGGCASAGEHRAAVRDDTGDRLTLGKVQGEIRDGMTPSEVASVLGSPNMVYSEPDGGETWIYDKVSTESVYSTSSGGVNALLLGAGAGGGAVGGGLGGAGYSSGAGASSKTQRTLTIIIKYGSDKRVRQTSYRMSSF